MSGSAGQGLTAAQLTALVDEIGARADVADQQAALPAEDIAALRRTGYLALTVPLEYGGAGLSLHDTLQYHLRLATASPATALVAGMQLHIFGHASETRPWPQAQFASFCRAIVEEGALFNSVASEPALGSPSRGHFYQATAVATDDGWCLNGHKTWTTGGRHLTHMLVHATIDGEPGLILVEQFRHGIVWDETWREALSLRASDSHDVHFHNVILPDENLVQRGPSRGPANLWFPMVMATVYLGAALAARNAVIRYALDRVPTALGRSIATLPKIQRQIGEMDLALQAAQALLFEVAATWTGIGQDRLPARVAAAKTLATETAVTVTDQALRIAGGAGITRALPLERYFRDVRAGLMQPPSGDAALESIGRAAIGPLPDQDT